MPSKPSLEPMEKGQQRKFREKVAQCRKTERGTLYTHPVLLATLKKIKIRRTTLWGQKKLEKNVAQSQKKIKSGNPLVPSAFVDYINKIKTKRGPLEQFRCISRVFV